MDGEMGGETPNGEVVNLTTFTPLSLRSPKSMYAASAFAALASGYGAVAVGVGRAMGLRSAYFAANSGAASACIAASAALRLTARRIRTLPGHACDELADRNTATSLDYSIIIPVHNRPDHVLALLERLSSLYPNWRSLGTGEVVVVDDGSTDETPAVARAQAALMPITTRVVLKENGGASSARNTGFAEARGRIGIAIDSDCLPEAEWLPSMLCCVRSDPMLVSFSRIRSSRRPVYPLENIPDRKGFVSASFAMDRAAYLKLGGFCLRYCARAATGDDRDFVLAALANGYRVGHAKNAWIDHPLRRETIRSMWSAGLNSKFSNLFASRHGAYAALATRSTAYYLFGIGSNYGSSIAAVVGISNVAFTLYRIALRPNTARQTLRRLSATSFVIAVVYTGGLSALGLRVGARIKDLPEYVSTLSAFQFATFLGRLRGTLEYGVFLL